MREGNCDGCASSHASRSGGGNVSLSQGSEKTRYSSLAPVSESSQTRTHTAQAGDVTWTGGSAFDQVEPGWHAMSPNVPKPNSCQCNANYFPFLFYSSTPYFAPFLHLVNLCHTI